MVDPGTVKVVRGRAFVANLNKKIAATMAGVATNQLSKAFPGVPVEVDVVVEPQAVGAGTGLILVRNSESKRNNN